MTLFAAFVDLFQNGPLWAQLAYVALGLFCLAGPTLVVAGLCIEGRKPTRYRRQLVARRRR